MGIAVSPMGGLPAIKQRTPRYMVFFVLGRGIFSLNLQRAAESVNDRFEEAYEGTLENCSDDKDLLSYSRACIRKIHILSPFRFETPKMITTFKLRVYVDFM